MMVGDELRPLTKSRLKLRDEAPAGDGDDSREMPVRQVLSKGTGPEGLDLLPELLAVHPAYLHL